MIEIPVELGARSRGNGQKGLIPNAGVLLLGSRRGISAVPIFGFFPFFDFSPQRRLWAPASPLPFWIKYGCTLTPLRIFLITGIVPATGY